MKSPTRYSVAVQVATMAIVVLGMLGGCLIVAHSGFGTSPRGGGASVFVPAPQAYVLAATMFGMSILGVLGLLQNRMATRVSMGIALGVYAAAAVLLTTSLVPQ